MPSYTVQQIYFGKFAEMDTVESSTTTNYVVENHEVNGFSSGTRFTYGDMKYMSISVDDINGVAGFQEDDNANYASAPVAGDTVTYDLGDGNGAQTSTLDGAVAWNTTVTLADGSSTNIIINFLQLEDGSVFSYNGTSLDNLDIQSITLDSVYGDNYYSRGTNVSADNTSVHICFARGMCLETDRGEVAVEDLKVGDLLRTYDRGYRPIRFIYRQNVRAYGEFRPVIFDAGAIGNDRAVMVSQNHRFYVPSLPIAGVVSPKRRESLIKASALLNERDIRLVNDMKWVQYFHIMLDLHELLYCHGTISESWQPHARNLKRNNKLKRGLLRIFPEIEEPINPDNDALRRGAPVRPEIGFVNELIEN